MKLILFIGIPATGKSTFYRDRFFTTHIRINLDMLKTRQREQLLVEACLAAKQPFVVDNTNPTEADRQRYIVPAKAAGFTVAGYYFKSSLDDAVRRNAARPVSERIPTQALIHVSGRLQLPSFAEGFDKLFTVHLAGEDSFRVDSVD